MSKTSKKFLALFISIIMLLSVIAGCSTNSGGTSSSSAGNSSSGSNDESKEKEPVKLTLMAGSGPHEAAMEAIAKAAEEKLNIKIQFDVKPGGAEGDNLVKTRLATDDMADILLYNSGSLLMALNPGEHFADLSAEPYADKLIDSYTTTVSANGEMYGVPVGSSRVGGILYNKKVYKELGLEIPRTWDDFMANNAKIKAAGKTAVITTFKTTWTSQLFVLANNYNVVTANPNFADDYTSNKAKYATTPEALKAFEMTGAPFENGYTNEDFQAATYDDGVKMLADGTGVHYPMLSHALAALAQNYPDKINDISVFPIPGDDPAINGLTVWLPNSLYINKKGKNVEAAKKFVEFFMTPENLDLFAQNMDPVGPYVVEGMELPENAYQGLKDMQSYFDEGKTAPALEFVSPIKGPSLENILIAVGSGLTTPLKGAEDYDKDVLKQAIQLGIEGW